MAVPRQLRRYVGLKADVGGPIYQAAYHEGSSVSLAFYDADAPDGAMFDRLVFLCDRTAPYLYSKHTPLKVDYERGSRRMLEDIVGEVTRGRRKASDKVLAIQRFVRDIPLGKREAIRGVLSKQATGITNDVFAGGAEEDVIRKHSSMCNEQARVMITMCQIAGIPARYVGHINIYNEKWEHMRGHGVVEAYVNRKWAYFDIRGQYFLDRKGRFLSAWEIKQDPSVIDRQPKRVVKNLLSSYGLNSSRKYFSDLSMTFIANYSVSEASRFDMSWEFPTLEFNARFAAARKKSHAEAMKMVRAAGISTRKPPPGVKELLKRVARAGS